MIELRPLRWPDDRASLLALDTSFTTDRIYHLEQRDRSFVLEELNVVPPLRKSYPLEKEIDILIEFDWVRVAVDGGIIVGLVAMKLENWNRRANLYHLYVAPTVRRNGVGNMMVDGAIQEAGRRDMRCIWVETQTVNYPAVGFYESAGFVLCGFDTSLYDPKEVGDGGVALFFSRNLA